jgi:tripartite-type tricarboxylate transporter receptor subunit TctC
VPFPGVLGWVGLSAPRATPKSVLDRLTDALDNSLDDQNVRKRMGELAAEIPDRVSRGQQPLAGVLRSNIASWTRIINSE